MKRKIFFAVALASLALFAAYGVWWHVAARHVADFLAAQNQIQITDRKINGFPGPLTLTGANLTYQGSGWQLQAPVFRLQALPFPGGIKVAGLREDDLNALDFIEGRLRLPAGMPAEATRAALAAWQAQGGRVEIPSLVLGKGDLKLRGQGVITLNALLQPEAKVNARVWGFTPFMDYLRARGVIDERQARLSVTLLSAMAQPDPETGDPALDIGFTLKDQAFYAGPLLIGAVAPVSWPE